MKILQIIFLLFIIHYSSTYAATPTESRERVLSLSTAEIKTKIISISKKNSSNLDNFALIRKKLNPLVDELRKRQDLDSEESLSRKIGVWKQLWTDDSDDIRANNFFQSIDREQTYQIVFEGGLFYNLTVLKTPIGKFSGFLRGLYSVSPKDEKVLNLEFTSLRLKRGSLPVAGELLSLTSNLEEGMTGSFGLPFGLERSPRGPVGAKGNIETIYIDEDLRVDLGQNFADGVVDLFVLVKE